MVDLSSYHGKYLRVTLKTDADILNRNFSSMSGILDASEAPIMKIDNRKFLNSEVSSYTVGNPKDYPYREL
jgi:hypothetical protein